MPPSSAVYLPVRTLAIWLAVALFATGLTGALAGPAAASADRLAGGDRIETSARVAAAAFPDGAEAAVLARADDYPDALAAAALAGVLEGPVLLTGRSGLSPATASALADLGVERVVLLGGAGALRGAVAQDASDLGLAVKRIEGPDRYATAAATAREAAAAGQIGMIDGEATALLASGDNFPDALSAGALAYSGRHPLLLTRPGSLPDVTADALRDLDIERVVLLGGTSAVSQAVQARLEELGLEVDRIGGDGRDGTAALLADLAVGTLGFEAGSVVLVRGDDFPDALSAGPLAGVNGAPILLSGRAGIPAATARWLADNCERTSTIKALGGTGVLAAGAVDQADAAARDCTAGLSSGDFPGADDTGVPAGTSLRPSGSLTVTEDGAVIDGLDVSGTITVRADGVTIRRTRVRTSGQRFGINVATNTSGTVIEDVEIVGTDDNCSIGIVHGHYTLRRGDVSGCVDGLRAGSNTTVEHSYVHDLRWFPGAHSDALQSMGGSNIRIVGNTLEGRWQNSTAAIIMGTLAAQLKDVLIEGNQLSGGTYTVYVSQSNESTPAPVNVRLVGNVWVSGSWKYGTHRISDTADVTWSGNTTTEGARLP